MSILSIPPQQDERTKSSVIARVWGRYANLFIVVAILSGNLLILGPYLGAIFTDQPWNNGYGYIAMTRVFRDFKWSWNPLIYGGAPLSYLYPPLFHALLAVLPFSSLGRAYHVLTAAIYAAIPACLYLLALILFRSKDAGRFCCGAL
ncbi:MAG: hypothetical protein WDO73_13555 [Ignavibacteriota bacterium]